MILWSCMISLSVESQILVKAVLCPSLFKVLLRLLFSPSAPCHWVGFTDAVCDGCFKNVLKTSDPRTKLSSHLCFVVSSTAFQEWIRTVTVLLSGLRLSNLTHDDTHFFFFESFSYAAEQRCRTIVCVQFFVAFLLTGVTCAVYKTVGKNPSLSGLLKRNINGSGMIPTPL